ncbi:synaptotagmin-15 [Anguilla anguilla]|uniref:synaptotagmin-15 n=1 Tax=Anguilla anguilla TaxID=7936 RepID=UPI0015AA3A05|nr:synaptotagmin-15 [Anguilla anguilla]
MAVMVWAVVGGVAAGVLFLLLIGAAAYFLFKRRYVQGQYRDLFPCIPILPACTSPVLVGVNSSGYRPGDIPFFLPPRHSTRPHDSLEEEEEEGQQAMAYHRGSLSIGASFPLGSLRPDLYRSPEEPGDWAPPCGSTPRLQFSVQYRQDREELLVSPLSATSLPPHCRSSAALVKLQLLPDDRRRRQAKARRKGRNPQFNDSFIFQVSSKSLAQATLSLSVFSVDRQKKHQLEGRALFPLRELDLEGAEGTVVWRDLETDNGQFGSQHGDLQVSLNYSVPLQRLTVVVLRARGLQTSSDAGVCVQVTLQLRTQVVKSKKSAVVRGGANPTFNKRLIFRLHPPQLDESCLCLELLQTTPGDPRSLGQVVIGPFMYARGRELDHWDEMVSKPQELVKQWHCLGRVSESQVPP